MAQDLKFTRDGHPFRTSDALPDLPWIVLTHGAFLSHSDFNPVLPALHSRFNILSWDLPGHGASKAAPATRFETIADAIAQVMSEAGVDRAHHLGFSFGGMVAQAFARRFPEKTSSLIAYGCVPITLSPPTPPPDEVWPLVRAHLQSEPWEDFCREFTDQASIDPVLQEAFYRSVNRQGSCLRDSIWEAMVFGASHEPDFWFDCPVAHIMGERDDRFPGAQERMLAFSARLPASRRAEIAGAGHIAHTEQPEAFRKALLGLVHAINSDVR